MYQDLANGEINNASLNQYLGQYYQSASDFFFKKKIELIFSIINIIVIFTIMFAINYYVASILLVFVPLTFLLSKKYENKLYANSEKNISNIDTLKNYINDENTLTKQERFVEYRQLKGIEKLLLIFKKDYMKSVKTKSIYLYCFSYFF